MLVIIIFVSFFTLVGGDGMSGPNAAPPLAGGPSMPAPTERVTIHAEILLSEDGPDVTVEIPGTVWFQRLEDADGGVWSSDGLDSQDGKTFTGRPGRYQIDLTAFAVDERDIEFEVGPGETVTKRMVLDVAEVRIDVPEDTRPSSIAVRPQGESAIEPRTLFGSTRLLYLPAGTYALEADYGATTAREELTVSAGEQITVSLAPPPTTTLSVTYETPEGVDEVFGHDVTVWRLEDGEAAREERTSSVEPNVVFEGLEQGTVRVHVLADGPIEMTAAATVELTEAAQTVTLRPADLQTVEVAVDPDFLAAMSERAEDLKVRIIEVNYKGIPLATVPYAGEARTLNVQIRPANPTEAEPYPPYGLAAVLLGDLTDDDNPNDRVLSLHRLEDGANSVTLAGQGDAALCEELYRDEAYCAPLTP